MATYTKVTIKKSWLSKQPRICFSAAARAPEAALLDKISAEICLILGLFPHLPKDVFFMTAGATTDDIFLIKAPTDHLDKRLPCLKDRFDVSSLESLFNEIIKSSACALTAQNNRVAIFNYTDTDTSIPIAFTVWHELGHLLNDRVFAKDDLPTQHRESVADSFAAIAHLYKSPDDKKTIIDMIKYRDEQARLTEIYTHDTSSTLQQVLVLSEEMDLSALSPSFFLPLARQCFEKTLSTDQPSPVPPAAVFQHA